MNRLTQIVIISILLNTLSCQSNSSSSENTNERGRFSYKNGRVAFTNFRNNIGSIYFTTNIDSVAQQLTFPKQGWDLVFDLSKDLSKILYINYPKANFDICNICLYDLKSKKVDTLLMSREPITSVLLSPSGRNVYFSKAVEIKNYSPIASKTPHGMDVFEITIENKTIRKLTDLNAYSIQGLSTTSNDSLLAVNIYDNGGLGLVSTKTGKFEKININSPRNEVKDFFFPVDIRRDSMIYVAPYELYMHNFKTNASQFILRCPDGNQFDFIQADNSWTNIFFRSGNKTYRYNRPTKELIEVILKID